VLSTTEEKKQYFNHYWRTRDLPSADARSEQRAEIVYSLLNKTPSTKILDVGCGRGLVMNYLDQQGYDISGCDMASESIASLQDDGYDVFLFDIERDELPGKYDIVLCLEVLQQIFDPVTALRKFSQNLNDDGFLIVSVPNEFHIWSRIKLILGSSHLGHFDESHIRLFTPGRTKELFGRAGLKIEQTIPVSIVPPGNKLLGAVGSFLARIMPSLFSLSQIYRLKP